MRCLSRQVQAPTGNIPKVLVYAYTGKITGISNYINVLPALSIQSDWRLNIAQAVSPTLSNLTEFGEPQTWQRS